MTQDQNSPFEGDAAIIDTAAFLARNDMFGVVWMDVNLIVRRTYGQIASFVRLGEVVSESLLPLIGQEDSIRALRLSNDPTPFTIPNVALINTDAAPAERARMNISLFWRPELPGFQVMLGRVLSQELADLTIEDEIRKRRIADSELARVNAQLEEFAYVISHDLKAPLRALRYYSEDVSEALDLQPPDLDVIHASADNIKTATRRMGNMLSGLLEFARLGRQQEAIEDVETAPLIDDIIANTGRPDGIVLTRTGDWPVIRAARAPFDLVLRNLVDNAIKHHDQADGRVTIFGHIAGKHLVIDVVDDGAGIAEEWHDAIFEPFKRIDDSKSPESSGIGLALVKRTIELAGGRIEVISAPERARGTTFRVSWPRGG